jgi:hypothetical protein
VKETCKRNVLQNERATDTPTASTILPLDILTQRLLELAYEEHICALREGIGSLSLPDSVNDTSTAPSHHAVSVTFDADEKPNLDWNFDVSFEA